MTERGDRLTVSTYQGPIHVERTNNGIACDMPRDLEMTPGQAQQLGTVLKVISQGPGPWGGSGNNNRSSSQSDRGRDRS